MKLSALNWICSRPCGGLLLLLKQSRINEGVPPDCVQFDRNTPPPLEDKEKDLVISV